MIKLGILGSSNGTDLEFIINAISEDVQDMMGITKVSNLNLKHDTDRVIKTMNLYLELEKFCKSQQISNDQEKSHSHHH